MSKQLLCLISFLLVLGMASTGLAQLEGYWPLDGDLLDASGNGRHGSWMGDPNAVPDANAFVPGAVGLALAFDGVADYISIDGYKGILGPNSFSITAWINTSSSSGTLMGWGSTAGGTTRFEFRPDADELRAESSGNVQGLTQLPDNEWIHVAVTVKDAAIITEPDVTLYLNGRVDNDPSTGGTAPLDMAAGYDLTIGRRHTSGRFFGALIDDVRLYSRELDADQVAEVMNGGFPTWPKADKPSPADGAMIEEASVTLSWRAGQGAVSHDVYLGTTADLGPDQLVSPQQTDTQHMAFGISPDQTYYWRIDEITEDGTVTTGDVWSIWTPPGSAYAPSPADGMINMDTETDISWSGGWGPIMHQVYFGTDPDQVANAVGAAPVMDIGYDPGPLDPGTTYYWRVDEFYGTGWVKGPVWSFATIPDVPLADDPNLIVHWPLDEAAGKTAVDMSGHGHHGTFLSDPEWVEGVDGSALQFDGMGDQVEHLLPEAQNFASFTIAVWAKPDSVGQAQYSSVYSGHTPNSAGFQMDVNGGDPGVYRINPPGGTELVFGPVVTEWTHLTLVGEGTALQFYYNGSLAMTGDVTDNEVLVNNFVIGAARSRTGFFTGTIDDFRFYDRAMTREEIRQTFSDPLIAWDPQPANGAVGDVWSIASLAWMPGDEAAEHDVYLGADADAVAAADAADASGIYRGRQADASYAIAEALKFETAYYWRVDEVAADGTVSAGRVWSFTTAADLTIFAEVTPFDYDTSVDPFASEISLDLDPALNLADPIGRIAVNYTGNAGSGSVTVDEAAGTTTVVGRGDDIWGTADQFQYAYTMIMGNGTMTVKVDSLANTDPWTKAGIMIRETLDAGSAFAMVAATGENGVRFQARAMADQDATSDTGVDTAEQKALNAPVWIKIERMFPMINAYYSTNGVTFTPMSWNPQVIPMSPAPIYIGLAVTSHSGAETYAEAVFTELSSDGGVTPGPLTSAEIGLVGNAAAPMSLVLTDASGATAAVVNPDPAAVQQTSATDFVVDLRDAAIDLTAVTKISLVIGDGTAGGSGSITINNVRLLSKQPLIVLVSGNHDWDEDGVVDDFELRDLLEAEGYKVDYQPGNWTELDDAKIAALNAADLVIISRTTASGDYNNGDEPTQWNSITSPMIVSSTHLVRNSRWKLLDTGGTPAGAPMMDLADGTQIQAIDETVGLCSFAEIDAANVGNGVLLASGGGWPWIVEWEAGVEYYAGAGQTAGGPRVFFVAGTQEVAGGSNWGEWNLTADGEAIYLDTVSRLLGN